MAYPPVVEPLPATVAFVHAAEYGQAKAEIANQYYTWNSTGGPLYW